METAQREDAVIVATARTPMGRYGGQLSSLRPDDLAAIAVGEVVRRAGVDPADVDDVILGCANQAGEDNRNVARMAALLANFPVEVPGQTVNRLCGSGMQALEDTALGWRLVNPRMVELGHADALGETAEKVAQRYGVSRAEQDALALRSHRRALAAQQSGALREEIVPVEVRGRKGAVTTVDADEGPRPDAELERLPQLRAAFREGGTVTAGNSSPLNDGAAAVVLTSGAEAARRGLEPLARFVDGAYAGVDPSYMGIGPVPATRKLLQRRGLAVGDVDLAEVMCIGVGQGIASLWERT